MSGTLPNVDEDPALEEIENEFQNSQKLIFKDEFLKKNTT